MKARIEVTVTRSYRADVTSQEHADRLREAIETAVKQTLHTADPVFVGDKTYYADTKVESSIPFVDLRW